VLGYAAQTGHLDDVGTLHSPITVRLPVGRPAAAALQRRLRTRHGRRPADGSSAAPAVGRLPQRTWPTGGLSGDGAGSTPTPTPSLGWRSTPGPAFWSPTGRLRRRPGRI